MKLEIIKRLEQIELDDQVTIFFACESGSRAWGFPSADSDCDVRFIYAHRANWYLAIDVEEKRDVIERSINEEPFSQVQKPEVPHCLTRDFFT